MIETLKHYALFFNHTITQFGPKLDNERKIRETILDTPSGQIPKQTNCCLSRYCVQAADLRGTRRFALMRSSSSSRVACSLGKRPLFKCQLESIAHFGGIECFVYE